MSGEHLFCFDLIQVACQPRHLQPAVIAQPLLQFFVKFGKVYSFYRTDEKLNKMHSHILRRKGMGSV